MKNLGVIFIIGVFLASSSFAGERGPVTISAKDKCPVCGMFVRKYPDWTSQIVFKDGSYAVFDGVKDMFKYYLDLKKHNPSHKLSDIDSIYVTDYYGLRLVDAYKADYVIGSDVYGPMGKEIIPFSGREDAQGFMKDHKGKAILKFNDITLERLKGLD